MTPTLTLVGLACAIAGTSPDAQSTLKAQLNTKDQAKVNAVVEQGYCLPEKLETLIHQSMDNVRKGRIDVRESSEPTGGGF